MLEICAFFLPVTCGMNRLYLQRIAAGYFFSTGRLRRLIQDTEQLSNPLVFWSARTDGSFARKNVQQKKVETNWKGLPDFNAEHQQLQRSRRIEMLIEVSWFWSVSPVELWWAGAQFQSVRFPDAFVSIDREKIWTSFESKSKSLVCETELAFKACLQDNSYIGFYRKKHKFQSWENISPVFGSDFWGSVFVDQPCRLRRCQTLERSQSLGDSPKFEKNILDRIVDPIPTGESFQDLSIQKSQVVTSNF